MFLKPYLRTRIYTIIHTCATCSVRVCGTHVEGKGRLLPLYRNFPGLRLKPKEASHCSTSSL